jgi:hypothetical protein
MTFNEEDLILEQDNTDDYLNNLTFGENNLLEIIIEEILKNNITYDLNKIDALAIINNFLDKNNIKATFSRNLEKCVELFIKENSNILINDVIIENDKNIKDTNENIKLKIIEKSEPVVVVTKPVVVKEPVVVVTKPVFVKEPVVVVTKPVVVKEPVVVVTKPVVVKEPVVVVTKPVVVKEPVVVVTKPVVVKEPVVVVTKPVVVKEPVVVVTKPVVVKEPVVIINRKSLEIKLVNDNTKTKNNTVNRFRRMQSFTKQRHNTQPKRPKLPNQIKYYNMFKLK